MHHKIGICTAYIGKDDMAAEHLEKALQLCDEDGILDRGYISVDLCIIYHSMKQNDKAILYGKEVKKFAANFKDTAFDEKTISEDDLQKYIVGYEMIRCDGCGKKKERRKCGSCEHFTLIEGCAKGKCSVRGDIIQRSRIICPHDYLPKVDETLC